MLWWMILACASTPQGGDSSGQRECVEAEWPLAAYEGTSIGVLPADVSALVAPRSRHTLGWADGTSTTLNVSFLLTGEAWFVDSEPAATDDASDAVYAYCQDRVEVGATIGFSTDDGAFAESWAAQRLVATLPGSATVYRALDLDRLSGSFAMEPYVYATTYADLRAWVHLVAVGPGAVSGAVEGQALGTVDDCLEATCGTWAERVEVATWGM